MTSMFDYDDSVNLAFDAKIAGKNMVAAKHELLTKTGDFLFLAHSERELAYRMQMVEEDIEKIAYRKLANVSDSKAKLVRTVLDEWQLRHASCSMCKTAASLNMSFGKDDKHNLSINRKGIDLHIDLNRKIGPVTDGTHNPSHPDSVLHPSMPVADGSNKNPKAMTFPTNPQPLLKKDDDKYGNNKPLYFPEHKERTFTNVPQPLLKKNDGNPFQTHPDHLNKLKHSEGCDICKKYNDHE